MKAIAVWGQLGAAEAIEVASVATEQASCQAGSAMHTPAETEKQTMEEGKRLPHSVTVDRVSESEDCGEEGWMTR